MLVTVPEATHSIVCVLPARKSSFVAGLVTVTFGRISKTSVDSSDAYSLPNYAGGKIAIVTMGTHYGVLTLNTIEPDISAENWAKLRNEEEGLEVRLKRLPITINHEKRIRNRLKEIHSELCALI